MARVLPNDCQPNLLRGCLYLFPLAISAIRVEKDVARSLGPGILLILLELSASTFQSGLGIAATKVPGFKMNLQTGVFRESLKKGHVASLRAPLAPDKDPSFGRNPRHPNAGTAP